MTITQSVQTGSLSSPSESIIFGNRPFDLTLEVVWFRELPS
ncbi:hypothetical protein [Curtobacterium sp. SL109]|nr:hypothetical protein [Curtobacterium sp. SL109]MCY1694664.1 hypothetical protein [Curtobacterium sp. SL109]